MRLGLSCFPAISSHPYLCACQIREHVKILTLDENVNRLTFEPDPPPPPLNVNRP